MLERVLRKVKSKHSNMTSSNPMPCSKGNKNSIVHIFLHKKKYSDMRIELRLDHRMKIWKDCIILEGNPCRKRSSF